MKRYTLKVVRSEGNWVTNSSIWSGDDRGEALKRENMAAKQYGKDNVWVCDNIDEITVG